MFAGCRIIIYVSVLLACYNATRVWLFGEHEDERATDC